MIIGAEDLDMATARLAAAMGMTFAQAADVIEEATRAPHPPEIFDPSAMFPYKAIEEMKMAELVAYENWERQESGRDGWYIPRRIGYPSPARRFQDIHRTRSRTHSQYKYSWRKMKPKKYKP